MASNDSYNQGLEFLYALSMSRPIWSDYEDEEKYNEALERWEEHERNLNARIEEYMHKNREASLIKELNDLNVYNKDSKIPEAGGITLGDLEESVKNNHGVGLRLLDFYTNPQTRYIAYMLAELLGNEDIPGVNARIKYNLNRFRLNPEALKLQDPALYLDLMNYQRFYGFYNPSLIYTGPIIRQALIEEPSIIEKFFDITTDAALYDQREKEGGFVNYLKNLPYKWKEDKRLGRDIVGIFNPFSDSKSISALQAELRLLTNNLHLFQDKDGNFTWFNPEWFTNMLAWGDRLQVYGDPGKLLGNLLLAGFMATGTTSLVGNPTNVPRLTQGATKATKHSQSVPTLGNLMNNDFFKLKFGVEGVTNLLGENGVRKTFNHLYNGEFLDASMSAIGDMWDFSFAKMGLPAMARFGGPATVNSVNKLGEAYNLVLKNYYTKSTIGQLAMSKQAEKFAKRTAKINNIGTIFGLKGLAVADRVNRYRYARAANKFANKFFKPISFALTPQTSTVGNLIEPSLWYGLPVGVSALESNISESQNRTQKSLQQALDDYNNETNPLEKRLKGDDIRRNFSTLDSNDLFTWIEY